MLIILLVLGLIAGSFVNALVYRLEHGQSIAHGRSKCPNCKHTLSPLDLIPVASWLALRGRCRYCKQPISKQYPIVELAMAAVFGLSYLFWPLSFDTAQWILLATWLVASVGLMALAIYDLRFMLLPNRVIYPSLLAAAVGRGVYTFGYAHKPWHSLFLWIVSIAITSGVFWVIFMVSKGKWIGFGDVRLGLITGTILASPSLAWAMLFFASLLGSLVALPDLIRGRKSLAHKLPFGPFLIIATGFVLLFGQPIIDWYKRILGA